MKNGRPKIGGASRLVVAFALTIVLGTVLLHMPMSHRDGRLSWLDSLFTSASAVCVTGLTTVDVGTQLSRTGQIFVLIFIQLGGLGITTFSTLLLMAAGRATLTDHLDSQEQFAARRIKTSRLLIWVIVSTLLVEAGGAVMIASRLPEADRWWSSVFHSVSAFCNSGFSLHSDSLARFQSDPILNGTVAGLIVLGGLGFIVHVQLARWFLSTCTGKRVPLVLHAKVVVWASLLLWVLGALAFQILESNHLLRDLTGGERALAACFQSVNMRTAGFSSVDFSEAREVTLYSVMFFMFVGAGPGSCAGGIKVTTAAVLLATIRARLRGEENVTLLHRTIPQAIVRRAVQLVIVSLFFVSVILWGLLLTEGVVPTAGARCDQMASLAFEAVSAFGTVGLSTGVTPDLSAGGKLIIILCMFVGRLGPLVIALAVLPERAGPRFEYPREDLAIG